MRNKIKQKQAQHKSYLKNKETIKERVQTRRKANKDFITEFKSHNPCVQCGEHDNRCLDFHHIDPKEKTIKICDAAHFWGRTRLITEMAKCIILCSNCHRKLHKHDLQTTTSRKIVVTNRHFLHNLKANSCCKSCDEKDLCCLEFHHTKNKSFNISDAIWRFGLSKLKSEINKCIILCSNCHRKIHLIS